MVSVNDDGIQTRFVVKVNYWFELVGGSASGNNDGLGRKSECSSIVSSGKLPDTLARRVEVEFPNGRGGKESFVITKRENVPVDSFQFASGTRVGVAVGTGESVSMYPSPGLQDPWKVSRDRVSEDACVWFPYIARHQAGDRQPAFSVDGVGAQEATLADLQALQTGTL